MKLFPKILTSAAVLLASGVGSPGQFPRAADQGRSAEEPLLRAAGIATDPAGLLAYFRARTLTDADQERITRLVRQLGSDAFAEREQASRELARRGKAVRPYLRQARQDPDLEIARRAERMLAQIDREQPTDLTAAAVRLLVRLKPDGAAEALLRFLPFADDDQIQEAIFPALLTLGIHQDRVDASLPAALTDPAPLRRAAVAYVLGRQPRAEVRAPVRRLLKDPDALVRFRAAEALLHAGEKAAVPVLVDLLAEGPLEAAWRAEEILLRLARDQPPRGSPADRRKWRDAWAAWWRAHGDHLDAAALTAEQPFLGLTLVVEFNTNRVWEYGADGRPRWELTNLQGPTDAHVLPGRRVLLAESQARRVSERDLAGKVLWECQLNERPIGCQPLPGGNVFIATGQSVREVTHDGTTVYVHPLSTHVNCAWRMRNGHVVYITGAGDLVEIDAAGKTVRSVRVGGPATWAGVQDLPGGRFLLTAYGGESPGKVLEVDAAGQKVWECQVPSACGVARLPNGNTLVGAGPKVVEVDRAGKTVFEKTMRGSARRVYVR